MTEVMTHARHGWSLSCLNQSLGACQLLRFLDDLGYRVVPIRGYADVLLAEKK